MSLSSMILTSLICSLGLILNICEIASLILAKRTRLTFDITLLSLSISDLLLALVTALHVILFFSIPPLATPRWWYWKFFIVFINLSNLSSALHMMFIAVQRLIAVLYPLKASAWITRKRGVVTIFVLWLASVVASVPMSTECYTYHQISSCSPFVIASVIIFCYITINVKLMTRKAPTTVARHQTQNFSILLYSICITAIYIFCAFPFTIYAISQPGNALKKDIPTYIMHIFYLQVVFDPVVYFFSQILKRTRCTIFSRICHCCAPESVSAS